MARSKSALLSLCFLCACLLSSASNALCAALPEGFVYAEDMVPDLKLELRYYSDHNFVGERIAGYLEPRCILTRQAAEALKKVQAELKPFGLGLKVYDAYRPQRAVDHFVRWARNVDDTRNKAGFYPQVDKKNLFSEGYIAEKSSHSRGSTVDLTIVVLQGDSRGEELDMGTGFDFFGPESWPDNPSMSAEQRAHRALLQVLMTRNGFVPYPQEWWHFTLKDEPYPASYFNFPVQ